MSRDHHWFLPQSADVLGMLGEQAAITVEGMEALAAWANGEKAAANRLRKLEHKADKRKRTLREALSEVFSTPLEPEDIFELSTGLDEVLDSAKNIVGEAEAMHTAPNAAIAEMAAQLLAGTKRLAWRSRCSPAATVKAQPPRPTAPSRTNATSSTVIAGRCLLWSKSRICGRSLPTESCIAALRGPATTWSGWRSESGIRF
jgi:hypothetical protein